MLACLLLKLRNVLRSEIYSKEMLIIIYFCIPMKDIISLLGSGLEFYSLVAQYYYR